MTQFNSPRQISCPHCGQSFAIQPQQWPQYQGQSINCTSCGQPFVVSAMAPTPPMMPPIPAGPMVNQGYPPGGYPQPGYGAYPPPRKGMNPWVIAAIVLCAFLIVPLLISILLPALSHVRTEAQKVKCSANLTQIGLACITYSSGLGHGELPDSMATLVKSGNVSLSALVCPETSDTPSATSSATTDAELAGHCSYVYAGKGLTVSTLTSNTVIAYEPLSNHHSRGINVLYGDFTVRWLTRSEAERMIQQLPTAQSTPSYTPVIP